jgi:hypothetical protein
MYDGREAWGCLPEVGNDEQLYAALHDKGLKTPLAVVRYLYEFDKVPDDRTDFKDLRQAFFKHSGLWEILTNTSAAEINLGLNIHHRSTVLDFYWEHCLPLLNTVLHHMWGDSKAFEKAGYDLTRRSVMGLPIRRKVFDTPKLPAPSGEP